jgi:purine-binding chemotaxis protein CheW
VATIAEDLDLIGFDLGENTYALPVGKVLAVCGCRSICSVPGAPPAVLGLVNWRGEIVTVLDTAKALGEQPTPISDAGQIVLLKRPNAGLGLAVRTVRGLRRVSPLDIRSRVAGDETPTKRHIWGEAGLGSETWKLLDLDILMELTLGSGLGPRST